MQDYIKQPVLLPPAVHPPGGWNVLPREAQKQPFMQGLGPTLCTGT